MNYQNYTLRAERSQPWAHRRVPFAHEAPTSGALAAGAFAVLVLVVCLLVVVANHD